MGIDYAEGVHPPRTLQLIVVQYDQYQAIRHEFSATFRSDNIHVSGNMQIRSLSPSSPGALPYYPILIRAAISPPLETGRGHLPLGTNLTTHLHAVRYDQPSQGSGYSFKKSCRQRHACRLQSSQSPPMHNQASASNALTSNVAHPTAFTRENNQRFP